MKSWFLLGMYLVFHSMEIQWLCQKPKNGKIMKLNSHDEWLKQGILVPFRSAELTQKYGPDVIAAWPMLHGNPWLKLGVRLRKQEILDGQDTKQKIKLSKISILKTLSGMQKIWCKKRTYQFPLYFSSGNDPLFQARLAYLKQLLSMWYCSTHTQTLYWLDSRHPIICWIKFICL